MGVEYEQVIERLEKIIENWFDKKELATVLFDCNHGLCKNLTHYEVDGTVDTKEEMLFSVIADGNKVTVEAILGIKLNFIKGDFDKHILMTEDGQREIRSF